MTHNIVFLFFNGGGLSEKQWYNHPFKGQKFWLERNKENYKSKLIKKIKKIGDIHIDTPSFYLKNKAIKISDLNLTKHCNELYDKIKNYDKIFIISHSRGHILSKFFCQLYYK